MFIQGDEISVAVKRMQESESAVEEEIVTACVPPLFM